MDIDGEEYDLDDVEPQPARAAAPPKSTGRPRGRPPGRRKAGTETTIIKRELTGEEDADDLQTFGALFNAPEGDGGIVRVRVISREPDEGSLGYIDDMDASEDVLRERWGCRTYVVQGIDATHRIRKSMQIKVGGGDPIFHSEAAEAKWRRANGLPSKAAAVNGGMSPLDLLKTMEERDEKRKREEREERREREEREAKAESRRREDERAWQAQREKDARDWEIRKAQMERDAEDRRRREEAERDDRRRKDDAERADRERRDRLEAEARSQQHMQQMLTMVKQSSEQAMLHMKATQATQTAAANPMANMLETVKLVGVIKDAFGGGGAGGEDANMDPISMLIKALPEMIGGIVPAIGATVREIRGGGAAPLAQAPQLPPVVASRMEQLAQAMAARGVDPEAGIAALLETAATRLATTGAAAPQPQQIAPAAPTSVSESDVAPKPMAPPPANAAAAPPNTVPGPTETVMAAAKVVTKGEPPVKVASGSVRMKFPRPA